MSKNIPRRIGIVDGPRLKHSYLLAPVDGKISASMNGDLENFTRPRFSAEIEVKKIEVIKY